MHHCEYKLNPILVDSHYRNSDVLQFIIHSQGDICIWDPKSGTQVGRILTGHKKYISSLAWQPLHCSKNNSILLASGSKDNTIKVCEITP